MGGHINFVLVGNMTTPNEWGVEWLPRQRQLTNNKASNYEIYGLVFSGAANGGGHRGPGPPTKP